MNPHAILFACVSQSAGGSDVTSMYSPGAGGHTGRIVRSPCASYLSCHLSEQLNINFMLFYFCYYKFCTLVRNCWKLRHKFGSVSGARKVINGACIHDMDIETEFLQ
jgi:hypothetical protein